MTVRSLAKLEPLFFGRVGRVLVGIGVLYWGAEMWRGSGEDTLLAAGIILLGVSFLIGGVMGNPGCEITALPNLFLPAEKHVHCV
jgi:hypothetical protein